MNKDYYAQLEIDRHSTFYDICTAYKKLSLRFHPDAYTETGNELSQIDNYRKFNDIAEAFVVLSNRDSKADYDKNGYQPFINGNRSGGTDGKTGFQFLGNPKKVFTDFFGTDSFFDALVQDEYEYSEYLKRKSGSAVEKPLNIEVEKTVSIQNVFTGCEFDIEFEKWTVSVNDRAMKKVNVKKQIKKTSLAQRGIR